MSCFGQPIPRIGRNGMPAGTGMRGSSKSRCSISAARPTRPSTMVSGGNSTTSSAKNRKELPQRTESTISSAQPVLSMVGAAGGGALMPPA